MRHGRPTYPSTVPLNLATIPLTHLQSHLPTYNPYPPTIPLTHLQSRLSFYSPTYHFTIRLTYLQYHLPICNPTSINRKHSHAHARTHTRTGMCTARALRTACPLLRACAVATAHKLQCRSCRRSRDGWPHWMGAASERTWRYGSRMLSSLSA